MEGLLSVEASRKHVRVILPRRFNAELLELTHSAQTIRAQDGEHCWYSFFHTADVALAATIAPP